MTKKIQKERKKEFKKLTVEKEIEIVKIVEKKQSKEKDLIEIRTVEEIVSKRFYKYLKMFKKKESRKMLTKKLSDHVIDFREKFVLKKRKRE